MVRDKNVAGEGLSPLCPTWTGRDPGAVGHAERSAAEPRHLAANLT